MEKSFFDWLAKNPELDAYRGSVVPANQHRAKWINSFDVRISQEFPGFMKEHKGEIALDIMNVGNLLNKKWGLIDDYGFYATRRVANYAGIDPATGKSVRRVSLGDEPEAFDLSPDGKTLYVSNRGHDSIAVYAIAQDGKLTLLQHMLGLRDDLSADRGNRH